MGKRKADEGSVGRGRPMPCIAILVAGPTNQKFHFRTKINPFGIRMAQRMV
jgi:hypothetical protein